MLIETLFNVLTGNDAAIVPTSTSFNGLPCHRLIIRRKLARLPLPQRRHQMRVAVYIRVSTLRQAQAQTPELQLERLQSYIQAKGYSLATQNIFRDDGYSGATLKRPGLDHLRDKAAAAEFDLILVTAPDRLARELVFIRSC